MEQQIEKTIEELFRRETAYDAALKEFAAAEHAYRQGKAAEYLSASGTIDERKAVADLKCADLMKAKLTAEAMQELTKVKVNDCRQVLSARQSLLSASVKVWEGTKNHVA